jgi:acyl-coenzyme A thioesterase PaaI-like protein
MALRAMSLYPPFLGAGVRVYPRDEEATTFDVAMRLTPWNRNYFGTHFGGSLYAMCDPFFVLILAENLGRDYAVWDKSATIRFRRAGRGTVRARFHIPPERIAAIRREVDERGKAEPSFAVEVRDEADAVVCEIEKLLHVTRRRPA